MSVVKFTETAFKDKGKKGILPVDEDGYRTVVLGGLNVVNSAGEYYTAEGAIELFNASSILMRRVKNGSLYSELGHPKRLPGMSLEDFYNRILSIEETNICGIVSEMWLDLEFGKKHLGDCDPNTIGILGKVRPTGAKAAALENSFSNPKENTAFSIRALCDVKNVNGRNVKTLTNVVGYDMVYEPGLHMAKKSFSPTVESIQVGPMVVEDRDTLIDTSILHRVLTDTDALVTTEGTRDLYSDILNSISNKSVRSRLKDW